MKTEKRGFSLIELMVIIAILAILSTVILLNLNGIREKSKDNATFTQLASVQGIAFKCLTNGTVDVFLNDPVAGGEICSVAGYSTWPTLTVGSDWNYDAANFAWCDILNKAECGAYNQTAFCGGSNLNGAFCYKFKNGTKYILCTQNGCEKSGF